jgi:aminoglycoside N3'-acetyltransferase
MSAVAATRETIAEGLRQIGLEYGDTLLVRVVLKNVGVQNETPAVALIQESLDVYTHFISLNNMTLTKQ